MFSPTSPSPFARSLGPADLGPSDSAAPGAQQTADYHHTTPSSHRASFLFDQQAAQNPHNHIHSESKNLSPDQVMELVQGLRSPVLATHQDEIPPASTPKRSGLSRSSSLARIRAESEISNVSRALDEGKTGPSGDAAGGLELEPVEYVEMNDDVLLPFVDRVAEVAELVEQPSNVSPDFLVYPVIASARLRRSTNPLARRPNSSRSFVRPFPRNPRRPPIDRIHGEQLTQRTGRGRNSDRISLSPVPRPTTMTGFDLLERPSGPDPRRCGRESGRVWVAMEIYSMLEERNRTRATPYPTSLTRARRRVVLSFRLIRMITLDSDMSGSKDCRQPNPRRLNLILLRRPVSVNDTSTTCHSMDTVPCQACRRH